MNLKTDIQKLVDSHFIWLKDKTILKELGSQWVEITTPYLDRHNDCIQIYVKKENGNYLLTDDGYIINDLISSGCLLDSPKRKELLKTTLAGFGAHLEDDQIVIHSSDDNFPLKKHSIIQSMLAVNDLFYLASSTVKSVFLEDVTQWMDVLNIRYLPKVKFTGKSGFDHMFDFAIPKSSKQPERMIEIVNNLKKDAVESLIFKWLDTRENRPANSRLFAILNNTGIVNSQSIVDAFYQYDVEPVLWTDRDKAQELLTA